MKKMKTIRVASVVVLIAVGAVCAWFWFTAFNQLSDLVGVSFQTPKELAEKSPIFSAALNMLDVDIFAPTDDPMGVIIKINGQLWRRTLLGVVVFLVGIGVLLFGRSDSICKCVALITGRVLVVVMLCFFIFLIWWSWHNQNKRLSVVVIDGGPNSERG